ncbi:MAG: purine-nucleoside phosphorylase, partial [Gemmata sp.]
MAFTPTFERFASHCQTFHPSWLVVLGSGLGSLFVSDPDSPEISFAELPGVPASTVSGHVGKWVLTRLGNHNVILSLGRLHYYEGHAWETVTRPVSLAAELGVKAVLLTNAAGGIRDDLQPGTIMPIRDHLEWNLSEPWRTPVSPCPYTPHLLSLLLESASAIGMRIQPGVYASVRGPSYETP